MESYFDSLPNNQIHKYFMPLYDNSLLVKSDVPNIFHKDITSKENSLPYVINMFTTPHTLLGTWVGIVFLEQTTQKEGKITDIKKFI